MKEPSKRLPLTHEDIVSIPRTIRPLAWDESHAGWGDGTVHQKYIRSIGFEHFLFSMYPLSELSFSGIGVNRRLQVTSNTQLLAKFMPARRPLT